MVSLIADSSLAQTVAAYSLGLLLLTASALAETEPHTQNQDLRLYRINKDGIASRFWFTRGKARKPGCHNIGKRSRLHRAVQFGYGSCRIYTKKNCADATAVMFTRADDATPTIDLSQGYSWFTISEHPRGVRIKSWHCDQLAK